MISEDGYRIDLRGQVALLTFDRPEKLNAITGEQMRGFGRLCRALHADPQVRAVVITGAGRGFCAGADLGGRTPDAGGQRFTRAVRFRGTKLDFISPLLGMWKPTIAAVNGIAVGAGLGIALACDIRMVGESGAFLANFAEHGIAATDGVPYLLPRIVGASRALEILYSAEKIPAARAMEIGLATHLYPDAELLDRALEMAAKFAAKAPVALQTAKQAVMEGLDLPWDAALARQELAYLQALTFGAGDTAEAATARREGRPPAFKDVLPSPED